MYGESLQYTNASRQQVPNPNHPNIEVYTFERSMSWNMSFSLRKSGVLEGPIAMTEKRLRPGNFERILACAQIDVAPIRKEAWFL